MGGYKTDQCRVFHRGRAFHFVSYEGQLANPSRAQLATAATWFLMNGGKRWAVMPQVLDQERTSLDQELSHWLDEHIFAGVPGE
jgi:hypothetical protein